MEVLAVLAILIAGGSAAASHNAEAKQALGRVGPAIERRIADATGGRFDARNYTFNARGKPVAFSRTH